MVPPPNLDQQKELTIINVVKLLLAKLFVQELYVSPYIPYKYKEHVFKISRTKGEIQYFAPGASKPSKTFAGTNLADAVAFIQNIKIL